jgi:predicted TIM-barrel fold metal-dependent hydrolase
MSFDFRVFVGQSFDGKSQTISDLLHSMDSAGIEKALACPFKPLSYDLGQVNHELALAVKDHTDRLFWAARVDPWQPEAPKSLMRALEMLGARALYLNPWEETFRADLEIADGLLQIADSHKIPVVIAAGYPWVSEALQILSLAKRWPEVSIVMTNGGQINISGLGQADVTLALAQSPNLSIDTAGVYRQDFIEETVASFGAQRVLFASGSPYFDQRYEIKRLQTAKVPEEDRRRMLFGNAMRLFGLT